MLLGVLASLQLHLYPVPWRRRLIAKAGVRTQRVHVDFAVVIMTAGQVILQAVPSFPRQCFSSNAPYLFTYRSMTLYALAINAVVK